MDIVKWHGRGHWKKVGEQTLIQIFNGQKLCSNFQVCVEGITKGKVLYLPFILIVEGLVFSPSITSLEHLSDFTTPMLFRVSFHVGRSPTKF